MTAIYALEQGAILNKNAERIEVTLHEETLASLPLDEVESVTLFGGVQVTTQALLALLDKGIDVSFLTEKGQFRGMAVSAYSKNIDQRYHLYRLTENSEYILRFAKDVTIAKIKNGMTLLSKYHESGRSSYVFNAEDEFEALLDKVADTNSVESLLGLEGAAAHLYYTNYGSCFVDGLFSKREYFPSPDPVNALLSLGYSLIAREIQALLYAHGFDPYVGLYHKQSYGRASLSLDLMEEYRHIVIDRLVLKLFNKHSFDHDDFEKHDDGGIYLKKETMKSFIAFYEDHMREKVHAQGVDKFSYRDIMRKQIEKFKRSIKEEKPYVPFVEE